MKSISLALALALASSASAAGPSTLVRAARLLDVRRGQVLLDQGILIEGARIAAVGPWAEVSPRAAKDAERLDADAGLTLLPGLIDCHTHLMSSFDPKEPNGYLGMLATLSQADRALIGAANARLVLRAGFTTVRDVENEGSGFADVALRDAIKKKLVQGPRMQVATRGIAAVGGYFPQGVSSDLLRDFPSGAQLVSGVEEARRAVREQLRAGADLIKAYVDFPDPVAGSTKVMLTLELRVIAEEAHRRGRKLAVHATSPEGVKTALEAGADSIEHGFGATRALLDEMKRRGVTLVPTTWALRGQLDKSPPQARPYIEKKLSEVRAMLAQAREAGVAIAAGSDGGDEGDHGKNAEELLTLAELGLLPLEAIRAATTRAAALLGRDDLGALEAGKTADLIAVEGDPLADLTALRRVKWVMKAGELVR